MKKLLAIILALCMFFSMAACGSKQAESTEAAGPSPLYRIPALPMRNPVKQN